MGEATTGSGTPIPRGDEILLAFARGEQARVIELIDESPLEAWFALPPDRMGEILHGIPTADLQGRSAVRAFRLLLQGDPVDMPDEYGGWRAMGGAAAAYFDARLHGQPERAARSLGFTGEFRERVNALFDDTAGWRAFIAVQRGIQKMLVGDLSSALASFAEAKVGPPPQTLSVLLRDAYVKGALIHALYGDPDYARRQLDIAAGLTRTQSWAEIVVDAHADLAETVLLADTDADAALEGIDRVPIPHVGELWPFRILATARVCVRAGRIDLAHQRIEELSRSMPVDADGYPGAALAIAIARSLTAVADGDFEAAGEALRVDPHGVMVETALIEIVLETATGDPTTAVMKAIGLHERTRGLQRVDVTRALYLAWALHRRGDDGEAVEVLSSLFTTLGPTMPLPMALPAELQRFATQHVAGWPVEVTVARASDAPALPRLTAAERRLLPLLADGRSTQQMAADLFLSVNTIKTQQRALFRKLGVSTRVDALLQAHRYRLI